jgi:hypothetical protein
MANRLTEEGDLEGRKMALNCPSRVNVNWASQERNTIPRSLISQSGIKIAFTSISCSEARKLDFFDLLS